MKYLIKFSPEITIKSRPVRKRCVLMLKNNIIKHFNFNNINFNLKWNWDTFEIEWNSLIISKILTQIPWVWNIIEVESFLLPEKNEDIFDCIFEKTKEFYLEKIGRKSFAVRVKRSWIHIFKSIDLEKYIGWWLLEHGENTRIKLTKPDITVKIEVKDKKFHIVKNIIFWIWGYPVWFQDRVLSLISGWFDSGVSTYSMMKRWCEVDFLFFNLWWNAHEMWVKQVSYYLRKTFWIPHKKSRFITVVFEDIIKELVTKVNHKYRWIILKRFMLRVASKISENHYYALVKWDSLWQVSSQTLKNMHVIDKASTNLVLRPLISFNKQEIIDQSQIIWTYNFACNMPEYCWVISDKPSTWAKEEQILEEELNISDDILQNAYENRKTEFVIDMMKKYKGGENIDLDVVFLPWEEEIVIDIRENNEKTKNPLKLENTIIIEIPFYDINHKFNALDQEKTYLLYCEKWVLSNLHWLYLKEKWFNNIKILRYLRDENSCNL